MSEIYSNLKSLVESNKELKIGTPEMYSWHIRRLLHFPWGYLNKN